MKYKLININSPCSKTGIKKQGESCTLNNNCIYPSCKEEHICSKITIDNFDYYIDDELKGKEGLNYNYAIQRLDKLSRSYNSYTSESRFCRKVIATNNSTLVDIPKVIDVKYFINDYITFDLDPCENNRELQTAKYSYKEGYNKAKETYQYNEKDMIEFGLFCANFAVSNEDVEDNTRKKLLKMWKEEKLTIIYYE